MHRMSGRITRPPIPRVPNALPWLLGAAGETVNGVLPYCASYHFLTLLEVLFEDLRP